MADFTSAHTGNEIDAAIASGSTTTGVIKDFTTLSGSSTATIKIGGGINTLSHITASGNISSSGIITAEGLVISDDFSLTDDLTVGGNISGSSTSTGSFGRVDTSTIDIDSIQGNWTNAGNTVADLGTITTIDINGGTINGITDLAVADGGTGASTFTDGGILLGNGTGAIQATAVLTDGQMLVGDGTTDPAIESGATLRTSIGVGAANNVIFNNITASGQVSASGGFVGNVTGNATGLSGTPDITVGSITAVSITSSIVTSSIVLSEGSNIFGDATSDTHTFNGGIIAGNITASGNISSSGTVVGSNLSGTNTGDITLSGTPDYITISGQTITRNAIVLTTDVSGVLPSARLDSDTAHLTTNQTFSGNKTFSAAITASGNISSSGTVQSSLVNTLGITLPNNGGAIVGNSGEDYMTFSANNVIEMGDPSGAVNSTVLKVDDANSKFEFGGGFVDIIGTTDATDATGDTGILRVEGGASIAKKLFVGTNLHAAAITASGNISASGTLDVTGNVNFDGDLAFDGTISGSSVTTGSFTRVENLDTLILSTQTVAAAGGDQAGATLIDAMGGSTVFVTGADSAKGVRLPGVTALKIGQTFTIHNTVSGQTLKVYPFSGDKILPAADNTSITIAANSCVIVTHFSADGFVGYEPAVIVSD